MTRDTQKETENMKLTTILTAAAIAALGTAATADNLARNNVPCATGSVYGFTVTGYGFTHYVQEQDLGRCPNAVGVPASVDIFEPTEVVAWLEGQGIEIDNVRLREKRERRVAVLDDAGEPVLDDDGAQVYRVNTYNPVNNGW